MRHEGESKEFVRREGNCVDGWTAEGNSGRDIGRHLTLMGNDTKCELWQWNCRTISAINIQFLILKIPLGCK